MKIQKTITECQLITYNYSIHFNSILNYALEIIKFKPKQLPYSLNLMTNEIIEDYSYALRLKTTFFEKLYIIPLEKE